MEVPKIDTSKFSEYQLFEPADKVGMAAREQQNKLFRDGQLTNPTFEYPRLDGHDLAVTDAAFGVAHDEAPNHRQQEVLAKRKAGVAIALASLGLQEAETHTERWHQGRDVTHRSIERYGDISAEYFWPVMLKWHQIADDFEPGNMFAEMTKQRVLGWLPEIPEGVQTKAAINQELIDATREEVMAYMEPVLRDVPEEGEFTALQTAEITQQSLENTGLAAEGWTVVLSDTAKIFSVKNSKKQVIIPNSPSADGKPRVFSADQLRRLLPHEVGIHAMRRDKSLGADFEEGMGVLVESVVTGQTDGVAIRRAEDRYLHVGLAVGVDGVMRNARQVFNITWRLEAMRRAKDGIITPEIETDAKLAVQSHIDNIFRGTNHKLPGVVYTKAKVYLEGLAQACEYAENHAGERGWLDQLVKNGKA